ncbi:MAG: hypothetical protein ACLQVD_21505 [Capsulimonadaceae bacterium]
MLTVQKSQTFTRVRPLVAASLLLLLAGTVHAGTLVDPFSDFSKIANHSVNWKLETDHPEYFNGSTSRLTRENATSAWIVYHESNITGFTIIASVWVPLRQPFHPLPLTAETSPDGTTWTSIAVSATPAGQGTHVSDPASGSDGGFFPIEYSSANPIPPGCNYVRFTLGPGGPGIPVFVLGAWTPELQEITITYGDALAPEGGGSAESSLTLSAPAVRAATSTSSSVPPPTLTAVIAKPLDIRGGFTVLAAGDRACLEWLPIPQATRYRIDRSTDAGQTETVYDSNDAVTSFVDKGLTGGRQYCYRLIGFQPDGTVVGTENVSVTVVKEAVILYDPFSDWGETDSHSDNLGLLNVEGLGSCVQRTSSGTGSFVYNLPGTVSFAFAVAFSGDFAGQVSVDASPDGSTWMPVEIANTDPVACGSNHFETVCSPESELAGNTNYLRVNLSGDSATSNSPAIAAMRVVYGVAWTAHR